MNEYELTNLITGETVILFGYTEADALRRCKTDEYRGEEWRTRYMGYVD